MTEVSQRELACTFTKPKNMLRHQSEGIENSEEWKS